MKRLIGALLLAATASCIAASAWAQQGSYTLPHIETMVLASKHHSASFPNGKDSLSFWLETGSKQTASANYDSTVATDTLSTIPLTNNWGMLYYHTTGTVAADSSFLGRLTLTVDYVNGRIFASGTDSIVVFRDVTPDGVNWISSNVSVAKTSVAAVTGFFANNEANNTIVASVFEASNPTVFNGTPATQTLCNCYGAKAMRFRLAMPSTLAKIKIKSATFTYLSTSPQREK